MKKIICLLLALTCVFTLFSCKKDKDLEKFVELVEASKPTKITTLTYYTVSGTVYKGNYETVFDGENFEMNYSYERKKSVSEGSASDTDNKVVESGVVYYKDGKYSEDGETWGAAPVDVNSITFVLDLSQDNLGEYTLSEDGYTLSTTVDAQTAAKVLGITINANDQGVKITVKTNGKYLTGVSVSYATATATVSVDTSYTYN